MYGRNYESPEYTILLKVPLDQRLLLWRIQELFEIPDIRLCVIGIWSWTGDACRQCGLMKHVVLGKGMHFDT